MTEQGYITSQAEMEKILYCKAVGSLLRLSDWTRPEVFYAVSQVAKYMANFSMGHWEGGRGTIDLMVSCRILPYLKGTIDRMVVYNSKSFKGIIGYDKGRSKFTPYLISNESHKKRKLEAFANDYQGYLYISRAQ